ncbi:transport and Golgi organization protein 1 isoform X2 [Malaya genurostris]|uniref:transport and Golgi organization protein 1 isoform X2 n=1 Tax=Malaya genurostris TaxID=325434 RepID=UPI0026F39657|nr:transport and Golgi organization protein 1 isoform X2 [Malaya genurostris]
MKKFNFTGFVHIYCLVLVLSIAGNSAKECGDRECKTPIATAYATLNYFGGIGQKVTFTKNDKLEILGRNVGKDKELLVRKADGKVGLASRNFLKEIKILVKTDDLISIPEDEPTQINPSPTVQPNVIEGTTIHNSDPTVDEPQASVNLEIVPSAKVSEPTSSLPSEPEASPSVENNEPQVSETEEDIGEDDETNEESEEDEEDDEGADENESDKVSDGTTDKETPETADKVTQNIDSENETISMNTETNSSEQIEKQSAEKTEQVVQNSATENETTSDGSQSKILEGTVFSLDTQLFEENQTETTLTEKQTTEIPLVKDNITGEIEFTTQSGTVESNVETEQKSNLPGNVVFETTTELNNLVVTEELLAVEQPSFSSTESVVNDQNVKESTNGQSTEADIVPEISTTTIVLDDARQEIPVTEEPELLPEIPVTVSSNQESLEHNLTPQESDLPKQPHQLLRGGLGNLLASSHHHHHHHHGNGHNHHHHHHLHGHDHGHHQHERTSNEQTDVHDHTNDGPFLGGLVNEHTHSELEKQSANLNERHTGVPEDGYCDQQSCPQPNPAQQPSIQHANGFHHPMAGNKQPPVDPVASQQESPPPEKHTVSSTISDESEQDELDYAQMIILELFKLSDLIILLGITSFTLIVFSLGHYLINKNRKEKPLIYKLNMIERDLMASHKENAMLKSDLLETRHKLTSIENNSFGSNDMVIALREELEEAEQTKLELQEQIASLEKELENAAEAGLELNKMVAELLNQSGSDSIALTVDELQKQLNEQQQTIMSMNTTLADKSRENSELQIALARQTDKFNLELEELQQPLNDLKLEKNNLEIELNSLKSGLQSQVETLQKESSAEINKLTKEVKSFQSKWEESKKALNASEAKLAAMQDCLKDVKRGAGLDGLIEHVDLKAEIAVLQKENFNLQDRLQGEIVARQLLEDHVKIVNEEISALKKDYSQAEKDKVESETRLEVLSTYFKDKETQLQKELSIKEAKWMQQQGETTSTVERIRTMQEEIQQLKSQNEKLRAEIEAQTTAHKAQYTALETRSHDAWLAARQAERRLDEARNESSALRRKLTALGDVSVTNTTDGIIPNPVPPADLNLAAPSPIRVESPNAPMMGLPPPPFMPPPFGPPFMPPFMPPPGPGEMRPAPLGRLMSPPPNRYSPNVIDNRDRFSPDRGRYSPDSRYDYSVMSNYETETDFSPPPSPPPHSRRSNYDRERDHRSDRERDRDYDLRDRERDGRTSGSGGAGGKYPKAFSPPGMRTTSPPIQDPRNKKYQGGFSSGSQDSAATRKSGKQYQSANRKPSP